MSLKKKSKKIIAGALLFVGVIGTTAFAETTYIRGKQLNYWNSPSSGYGQAATSWHGRKDNIMLFVTLYRADFTSSGTQYKSVGSDSGWQSAGAQAYANPDAWSSTHKAIEGGNTLFDQSLWRNAK